MIQSVCGNCGKQRHAHYVHEGIYSRDVLEGGVYQHLRGYAGQIRKHVHYPTVLSQQNISYNFGCNDYYRNRQNNFYTGRQTERIRRPIEAEAQT